MVLSRFWGIASVCATLVSVPVFAQPAPVGQASPTKPQSSAGDAHSLPERIPEGSASAIKEACIAAHSETQQLRQRGQLLAAKARSNLCVKDECPSLIRQECADLLLRLDEQIPSIIIQATNGGTEPIQKLKVEIDGHPVVLATGKALQLDPGEHKYRAEADGHSSATGSFVIFEGRRYQEVSIRLQRTTPIPATETAPARKAPTGGDPSANRPIPPWTIALAGVGAAGLASFGVWAYLGSKEEDDLKGRCSPNCTDDEVSAMNTRYAVADVSLALGGVALGAAALTYIFRPTRESAVPPLQVQAGPTGISARIRF